MANYTPNFELEKPLPAEDYDIEVFNRNADTVDAALANTYTIPQTDGLLAALRAVADRQAETVARLTLSVAQNTARIDRMEDMLINGVSANPFAYAFGSLEGLEVEGVWNRDARRIEF